MSNYKTIQFFELNINIPAQEFRIEYTLIENAGLPFVPEFILRLLNVCPFYPKDLAQYFSFSKKDLKVAIEPLMEAGFIETDSNNMFILTTKGKSLFIDTQDSPNSKNKIEYRKNYIFDLINFMCHGSRATMHKMNQSIVLDVGLEARSKSIEKAKSSFQRDYRDKIYQQWDSSDKQQDSDTKPELYKISDIEKRRDVYLGITEQVVVDISNNHIYFKKSEDDILGQLIDSSNYLEQRDKKLGNIVKVNNQIEIVKFATDIQNDGVVEFVENNLNFNKLLNKDNYFLGSLVLKDNWKNFYDKLLEIIGPKNEVELNWIFPSNHDLWLKSDSFYNAINDLMNLLKQYKKLSINFFIPIANKHHYRIKDNFTKIFRDYSLEKNVKFFVESEEMNSFECIIVDNILCMGTYHITDPNKFLTPIPISFLNENENSINIISRKIFGIFNQIVEDGQRLLS